MARYFKFFLPLSTALLVGCGQTSTSEYGMSGYQVYSLEWPMPDGSRQNVVQRGEVSQASVATGSVHGSPEPAVANNSNINTAAVIAVLALLVLVILADDVSACSGSGCASSGTN